MVRGRFAEGPGMDALDLTQRPPRPPREPLAGLDLIMAARTVDKLRASLPGGNLGIYHISGFSEVLLKKLGITEDEMRAVVQRAAGDADVAAWIAGRSTPEQIAAVNDTIPKRLVKDRVDDPEFVKKYPLLPTLPGDTPLIDMLPLDDAAAFASKS